MNSLSNVFYIDKDGNLVQLDELLAKSQDTPIVPPKPEPEPEPDPNVAIIGGRAYKTVTIGNKTWLAENLDFKFDGLAIGEHYGDSPAAAYYDNDEATYGVNGNKYGLLYNVDAVIELVHRQSELTPGWHVPTLEEWQTLIEDVGGTQTDNWGQSYDYAGTKLKSTTGWITGNGDGDSGFEAFPAGWIAKHNGQSFNIGEKTSFWSSTSDGSGSPFLACTLDETSDIYIINRSPEMASIRLIKD